MKLTLHSGYPLLAATAGAAALVSCTQVQPSVYGTFDARSKTMAVPVCNVGGMPKIKDNLRREGWDIRISGANVGNVSTSGNALLARNASSRYTMAVEAQEKAGYSLAPLVWWPPVTLIWLCSGCPSLSTDYLMSITVYDNRDGRELLTYAGFVKTTPGERDTITQAIVENTH